MNRKIVFDAVRKLLGRGFTVLEVRALDAAIDRALQETGEQLARETNRLTVSKAGIDLIKEFEGCRLDAYTCPAGKITIGWGATRMNGKPVPKGLRITQEVADSLLAEDVERHARDVRKFIGDKPTTQSQFDALVSFHFNTGRLPVSTLGRKHRGGDYDGAAAEFAKWKFAGNKILNGLVRRRAAERALYEGEA